MQSVMWVKKAGWQAMLNGGRLQRNGRIGVHAPLRCDGKGRIIIIEVGVMLGYRKAPRLGSGEILLQARSPEAAIKIGARSIINNNVSIIANRSVVIGNDCLIGDLVSVYDSDFHEVDPLRRNENPSGKTIGVEIGNHVWLGSRAIILKGVHIGDNSVVAAGSVVTKSIPANTIAAGNPARIIRGQ